MDINELAGGIAQGLQDALADADLIIRLEPASEFCPVEPHEANGRLPELMLLGWVQVVVSLRKHPRPEEPVVEAADEPSIERVYSEDIPF